MKKRPIQLLLLEDNPADARLMSEYLREDESMHFDMHLAGSLQAGLTSLAEHSPDIILADLGLPDSQGLDTFKQLFAVASQVPIVILTGLNDMQQADLAVKAGAQDYLNKDEVNPILLRRAVRYAIERKQSLEALRQSEAQYRLLAENLQDVIWVMDLKENRLVYISPSVIKLTGYTPEEVLATPFFDTLTSQSAHDVATWMRELIPLATENNQSSVFIVEQPCKDGSTVWSEVSASLMLDANGIPFQIIGVSRDISARRQSDQQIRLQAAALGSAANAIVITDREGSIQWVNPAYEQLTGFSLSEVIGQNPRLLKSGLQPPEFYKNLWDTILAGQVWQAELVNKRKDGSLYTEEETITPLLDDSGAITHFIGIKQDISQRKQSEEALSQSEAELRALFAALPDLVLMLDKDGRYFKITETNQDLLYKPLEELIGKTLHDVFPIDEADRFLGYILEVLSTKKTIRFEYSLMIKDKEIWFSATVTPMTENAVIWVASDVSDGKKAELELQESHSLLKATLESTAEGILVVDLQGRISMTNAKFVELWSIPQAVLDRRDAKATLNYVVEKLKEPQVVIAKVEQLYASPESESFDVLEFKDGRIFERVSRPQYRGETIVGRVWSFRDVTERKRSEQAILESGEKFKTLFNSANDAIFIMDQTTFLDCNVNTEKIFGCSRDQIVGHSPVDFSPEKQPDGNFSSIIAKEKIEAAFSGKPQFFEWVHTHLDGTPFYAEVSLNRVLISGDFVIQAIVRDISNRKQAEYHLLESEAKYRSLFDNVPDGVYRSTPDGRILAANEALVAMLGYESEIELMNDNAVQMYTSQDERNMFLKEIDRSGVVRNMEVQLNTKQGKAIVGLENARAFYDENGKVLHYEGTLTDITERKQVELERQTLLEIMQGLTITDDLNDYLEIVHQSIGKVIEAKNFFVALNSKTTGLFDLAYIVDEFDQKISSYEMGKTLGAYVYRSSKPYLFDPQSFDELCQQGLVELVGAYSPSWLGVPLIVSNQAIGVMVVKDYENENRYSQHDVDFLTSISGQVAGAIRTKAAETELAQLYETEQRRSQRLSDLQLLGTELTSLHSEQELLESLVKKGALLSNSPVCTVLLLDVITDEIILAAHFGLPASVPKGLRIPVALLQQAANALISGKTIIISNIDQEMPALRKVLVHPDVQSFFAFPLVIDGVVTGTITLSSLQPRHPSVAEIHTYELLARLASAALDNVRLFEGVNRSLQRMGSLRRVDMAISSSFDLVMTLNILLEQVTTHLGVDAADILVLDTSDSTLKYTCGRGFHSQALKYTNLRIGEGFAGQAAMERRTIHVPDLQEEMQGMEKSSSLPSEGFISYWGVPLLAKGNIQGVLEVFNRQPIPADKDWVNFLETLAGQAAIAVDNVQLFNHLERSNADLSMAYDSTLTGWATALELRDNETEGHTRRVAVTTTLLAGRMGVHDEDIRFIRWGSLLHDIGKMGIPDSILLKPGPLSDEEWVIMRTHPVLAYEMLSPIHYLGNALDIPYCHHEKWDGSGYPRGLKGEQIPLAARIFAIVDVWDALTSDRPYRSAWTPEKTMSYIQEQVGTHFDPQVAKAFMELIGPDGILPGV